MSFAGQVIHLGGRVGSVLSARLGSPPRNSERLPSGALQVVWDFVTSVAPYLTLGAVLVVVHGFLTSNYHLFLANLVLIYCVAVIGVNIILGYAGILSIGHAATMAVGAYASAIFMLDLGLPFPAAFVLAIFVGMVVGSVAGILACRVGGYLFLLVTFGMHQSIILFLVNQRELTGGASGLSGIPAASIGPLHFSDDASYFSFLVPTFLVALYLAQKLKASRPGRAMFALKQSEEAAAASGVDVTRYKVMAMAVGSAYLAAAGALLAHELRFLAPASFSLSLGLLVWLVAVLGGMRSNIGVVSTMAFMVLLLEYLRPFGEWWILIFGVTVMVVTAVMPGGLAGLVALVVRRVSVYIREHGSVPMGAVLAQAPPRGGAIDIVEGQMGAAKESDG